MNRGGVMRQVEPVDPKFLNANVRGVIQNNQIHLDPNQMKASWAWFMRRQQEWHQEILKKQKDRITQQVWDSCITEFDYKGYHIVPLNSAHDLFDEGKDMHHCVGDYAKSCLSDRSRIFSIRKDGVKVATLELTKRFEVSPDEGFLPGEREQKMQLAEHRPVKSWEVNQVRGHCNAVAPTPVQSVAKEVAKRYTKAAKGNLTKVAS
jgi:hypothetical protein